MRLVRPWRSRVGNGAGRLGLLVAAATVAAGPWLGCGPRWEHSAVVTASAYNSVPDQTQGDPNVAAWGDELRPGMKAIAVSRDLLERGLTRGTKVKIEGLRGTYTVLDTMHARWTERIDIYLGTDIEAAREWGKRKVTIHWSSSRPGHEVPGDG